MKKLRLLVTKDCPRNCEGCCNKDWNLDNLPVADDLRGYSEIIITGGEPLMSYKIDKLNHMLREIHDRKDITAKVYVYTANPKHILLCLPYVDGITLTLHDQSDVAEFEWMNRFLPTLKIENPQSGPTPKYRPYSYRLNIFKGVTLLTPDSDYLEKWRIKDNIEWIKDCPLPEDEEFKRLETFL